jgi:hypothetical protein
VVAVVQIVADDLVNRAGMEGAALLPRDSPAPAGLFYAPD